ncbi:DUF445 family protein [Geitlerinema sp. PCC 9228]|uniref:DUF445 domain-containing protein n=1 Tax=Geitlerinema sp. PCC 9228 TaxID=111611 RepID=UPI00147BDE2C|nr:DUF445 family protein [Geitlerinema sp. PCC 9228]
MDLSTLWLLVAPPVAGGIIGYFTNDLAIKMLFRPYKPWYLFKRKLPFTPGLIPANQDRLAKRVSDTIMGSLLTPEEIQNLARRLLQTERTQAAIRWLLQMALEQVKYDTNQKTTKILANILRDLTGESIPNLLKVLARREDFLKDQLNQIFDRVLLEFQLNEAQAQQLADWLLDVALTPDTIRSTVVDFLTDRNIAIIDDNFREKSHGTYWVVANLFGLRNALTRLRNFCLDEKETANAYLADWMQSLQIRTQLKNWLQDLSLQNLPVSTVRQLRATMRETVRSYLQSEGASLLQGLSYSVDWEHAAQLLLTRLQSSAIMESSLDSLSKELALVLDRYLERDLETIVAKAIPILNIDQVIVDRVNATPAQELESSIQGIVKTELQAIVNLGGILGTVVGSMQSVLLFIR